MFLHGLFGIGLHAGVNGGVYFQTVVVEVIFCAVGLAGFLNPAEERVCSPGYGVVGIFLFVPGGIVLASWLFCREHTAQFFPEVWREAFFVVHAVEVERKGFRFQRVEFGGSEHVGLVHLFEHHIAAGAGTFGFAHRVEV